MTKVVVFDEPVDRTQPRNRKLAAKVSLRWVTVQGDKLSTVLSYLDAEGKRIEDRAATINLSAQGVRDIAALADSLERKLIKHLQDTNLLAPGVIEGEANQ